MVAQLNFGLLQPVDLSGAVQAFDQARARRMQQQQVDQQGQRLAFEQAEAERQADQQAQARAAKAAVARQLILGRALEAPQTAPAAPMAATPAVAAAGPQDAPVPGEDAMMTVTAPSGPNIWERLIDADPDQAIALFEKSRSMDNAERERVSGAYDTLATAAADLTRLPYEQRRAALMQMAPMLEARGVPMDMIEGFDPTDVNLQGAVNNALGLKEVFMVRDRETDNQRAEREFSYRQQNDAANRAVTLRGQNMSDARQRELAAEARRGNEIKLTESQGKATGFLRLAQQAESTLAGVGGETAVPGEGARMAYGVPFIERAVGAGDRQVLAAQEAFAEASLRFLTGAAVTKEEARRNITQFYPSPGDTPDVVQQKAAYRQQILAGMRDAAGPGAARVQTIAPPQPRAGSGNQRQATPRVTNEAEWRALPRGTVYIDPNGRRRTKQ